MDGEWKVSPGEAAVDNAMGTQNNMITINDADFEEFENALLRDPNDKKDDKPGNKNMSGKEKEGRGYSTLWRNIVKCKSNPSIGIYAISGLVCSKKAILVLCVLCHNQKKSPTC